MFSKWRKNICRTFISSEIKKREASKIKGVIFPLFRPFIIYFVRMSEETRLLFSLSLSFSFIQTRISGGKERMRNGKDGVVRSLFEDENELSFSLSSKGIKCEKCKNLLFSLSRYSVCFVVPSWMEILPPPLSSSLVGHNERRKKVVTFKPSHFLVGALCVSRLSQDNNKVREK